MIESGYMQIRWYQQSSQGTKSAISEKKRLPPVAIAETRKATHSSYPQIAARSASSGPRTPTRGSSTATPTTPEQHLRDDAEDSERDDDGVRHVGVSVAAAALAVRRSAIAADGKTSTEIMRRRPRARPRGRYGQLPLLDRDRRRPPPRAAAPWPSRAPAATIAAGLERRSCGPWAPARPRTTTKQPRKTGTSSISAVGLASSASRSKRQAAGHEEERARTARSRSPRAASPHGVGLLARASPRRPAGPAANPPSARSRSRLVGHPQERRTAPAAPAAPRAARWPRGVSPDRASSTCGGPGAQRHRGHGRPTPRTKSSEHGDGRHRPDAGRPGRPRSARSARTRRPRRWPAPGRRTRESSSPASRRIGISVPISGRRPARSPPAATTARWPPVSSEHAGDQRPRAAIGTQPCRAARNRQRPAARRARRSSSRPASEEQERPSRAPARNGHERVRPARGRARRARSGSRRTSSATTVGTSTTRTAAEMIGASATAAVMSTSDVGSKVTATH